jgi:hypothetical protein
MYSCEDTGFREPSEFAEIVYTSLARVSTDD